MEEIFLANSQTTKPIAPLVNTLFRLLRPASVNPKITARSKINPAFARILRVNKRTASGTAIFPPWSRVHETFSKACFVS